MNLSLPDRIYVCPECGYISERRWVLARHLYNVHDFYKKDAANTAILSEYRRNPFFNRKRDLLRRYTDD
jgi:hypothetical protein